MWMQSYRNNLQGDLDKNLVDFGEDFFDVCEVTESSVQKHCLKYSVAESYH